MLLTRRLTVAAGGRTLLEGLDLDVARGERVAVRAPSGFGKTSLLRALALLDEARFDRLELDGVSPGEMRVPAWRSRVCFVDGRTAGFAKTVAEALARPFTFAEVDGVYQESEAQALLTSLLLPADLLERDPGSLSAGELQRVCLARALLIQPRVLLLDEPTSALDDEAAATVEALLRQRAAAGLAMVIVSHDAAQAERLGARVLDLTAYGHA